MDNISLSPRSDPYAHQPSIEHDRVKILTYMPLDEGIQTSLKERTLKTQSLSAEDMHEYQQISSLMEQLQHSFCDYLVVSQQYYLPPKEPIEPVVLASSSGFKWKKQDSVNPAFKEAYELSLKNLEDLKGQLQHKYGIMIPINTMLKNVSQERLNSEYTDFIFDKERALNRFVNAKTYLKSAKIFIIENIEAIFSGMTILSKCDSSTYIIDKIEFISKSGETHNQGKKPLYITLKSEKEQNEIKLVLKPRNAGIDKSVIELFGKLNTYDSNPALPVYEIFNIGAFSVWENIKGPTLHQLGCPSKQSALDFILKLEIPDEQKNILINKLKKMACILSILGVSDIHSENVILKGAKLEDKKVIIEGLFDIVPIDLEVIIPDHVSYLIKMPIGSNIGPLRKEELDYPLSDESKKCVINCQEELSQFFCRVLVMDTEQLNKMECTYMNCEELCKTITETFGKQGYEINEDKLKKMIIFDMLNSDISFFTNIGNLLYHGFNNEIGIKK